MIDLATLLAAAGWIKLGAKVTKAAIQRYAEWHGIPLGPGLEDRVAKAAIQRYAEWHGIPLGPGLEDRVAKHASLPRCGRPDVLAASENLIAWPDGLITARQAVAIPGMTAAEVAGAWRNAFARLAAVCGITPSPEATGTARILAKSGRIDGPGSVLAWSEMPTAGVTVCDQLYDTADPYPTYGPRALEDTMVHEIGHALGLDHSQDPADIMYPVMRFGRGAALGPGDIRGLRARYGPPMVTPPEPPDPGPPTPQPPRVLPSETIGDLDFNVYDHAGKDRWRIVLVKNG